MTSLTTEGDGFVISCECLWLRWFPAKSSALDAGREHAEKCKGPRETTEQPKARGRARWDDREGSTWIDKL